MRNLIILLSTFTLTVLMVIFTSVPAVAGGAGGSWGCPSGWTTKPDGSCSFDGGGGGTGGSGAGGSWIPEDGCFNNPIDGKPAKLSGATACGMVTSYYANDPNVGVLTFDPPDSCIKSNGTRFAALIRNPSCQVVQCPVGKESVNGVCVDKCPASSPRNAAGVCEFIPPPPFPDPPPPPADGECNVCAQLYQINLKLNHLKNQDINAITNIINNMQTTVNNIDNSITSLNVEMNTVNNNLTTINNNMGDLITNIENNNITNNEILNVVNNIDNSLTDYALQLGDIKLALGDIDVKLDNTNKLILDLGLDIDWIKNKLVNGSPEGKDYTQQLNEIIELLKPCVPTAGIPCPDDDAVVKKLKEIQDYMEADFEPDTDSTEVEVDDLTDIELDRDLIKFGVAQCPPDSEFSTIVNGFSFSGGFKHKPLCDFFTLLSPFIKAFGGFSAALILGGGLRRG